MSYSDQHEMVEREDGSWFGLPEEVEGTLLLKLATARSILTGGEEQRQALNAYTAGIVRYLRGDTDEWPEATLTGGMEIPAYVQALVVVLAAETVAEEKGSTLHSVSAIRNVFGARARR